MSHSKIADINVFPYCKQTCLYLYIPYTAAIASRQSLSKSMYIISQHCNTSHITHFTVGPDMCFAPFDLGFLTVFRCKCAEKGVMHIDCTQSDDHAFA